MKDISNDERFIQLLLAEVARQKAEIAYLKERETMMTIYDDKGDPFSKWKAIDKFAYKFAEIHSDLYCEMTGEFLFHPTRKWRLDFAWPDTKVAVEVDGFGWGHQSQQGMSVDNEKANAAVKLGWRLLRFNTRDLSSIAKVETAVELVASVICGLEDE